MSEGAIPDCGELSLTFYRHQPSANSLRTNNNRINLLQHVLIKHGIQHDHTVTNELLEADIKKNYVALVRERTLPTERLPPVGKVSANFCG
jgi:hypothetical protein